MIYLLFFFYLYASGERTKACGERRPKPLRRGALRSRGVPYEVGLLRRYMPAEEVGDIPYEVGPTS